MYCSSNNYAVNVNIKMYPLLYNFLYDRLTGENLKGTLLNAMSHIEHNTCIVFEDIQLFPMTVSEQIHHVTFSRHGSRYDILQVFLYTDCLLIHFLY